MRLALIFLFACGAPRATEQPPGGVVVEDRSPKARECARTADREMEIIGFVGARTEELRRQIKSLCMDHPWTAVWPCLQTAKTLDDLTACNDKLAPDQRAAFERLLRGSDEAPPEPPPPPLPELHNRQ